jgi:hypothetical protein
MVGVMANTELFNILQNVTNAKRVFRDQGAEEILRRPDLLCPLVDAVHEHDAELAVRAAWILERVCVTEIRLLIPYVKDFANGIETLKDERILRPASKICSLLSREYMKEPWEEFDPESDWINAVVSVSFEWLTGPHNVATQVFAMDTLHQWGTRFDWIHGELLSILDREYAKSSSGYRSRARKIMDKILLSGGMKKQN